MAIDSGVLTQLKEHYTDDIIPIMFEDGKDSSPLLAMCEVAARKEGFGRGYIERVITSEGSAIAADATIVDTIVADGAVGARPSRQRWEVEAVNMDAPFTFSRDEI